MKSDRPDHVPRALHVRAPALVYAAAIVTYGTLGLALTTACGTLRRFGLQPGAIVAIRIRNPIPHVALILTLELCGITTLSVQTRYAIGEAGLKVDALLVDTDADLHTVSINEDWFALAPTIELSLRGGCRGSKSTRPTPHADPRRRRFAANQDA